MKKEKTQKIKMTNLVRHVVESQSNCGMGRKGVHHHMSITVGTNINETGQLNYKYPIFCRKFSSMLIVNNDIQMEDDII